MEKLVERREQELSDPDLHPVRRKPLVSLANRWNGLTLFVDHPEIPMDNNVGQTQGRGKLDIRHQAPLPIKDIWLYPLEKKCRRTLCA